MSKTLSSATSRLHNHFVRCGLSSKVARVLTATVHKWIDKSGPEWAVDRLKSMKQHIIHTEAGEPSTLNWVATHRDGSFKGPFRALSKLSFEYKLAALNAYSSVTLGRISPAQKSKAVNSITAEFTVPDNTLAYVKGIFRSSSLFPHLKKFRKRNWSLSWEHDLVPFKPGGLNTSNPVTMFGSNWVSSFIAGLYNPHVADYLEKRWGFDASMMFDPTVPELDDWKAISPGTITCIQERGCKARVVAMPNAALQSCLRPFHEHLNDVLKTIVTDCTFDQDKGAIFAMEALKSGKTVHSVDLSSATDRFPAKVQLDLLVDLGYAEEAKLIGTACRNPWHLDPYVFNTEVSEYVRYGAGQPMGLYGSFALFALTHNMLLHSICEDSGVDPANTFRVLGDDVVITCGNIASRYRKLLKTFNVPISTSKSITSNKLAEFAGYVITPDRIFKPPKVAKVGCDHFESYIRCFGYSAIKDLPARVRRAATAFAEAPEEVGGLGLNPKGKPLAERLAGNLLEGKALQIPCYSDIVPKLLKVRSELRDCALVEAVDFLYDQYKKYFSKKFELGDMEYLRTITSPTPELITQLRTMLRRKDPSHRNDVLPSLLRYNVHQDSVKVIRYDYQPDFIKWQAYMQAIGAIDRPKDVQLKPDSPESHEPSM